MLITWGPVSTSHEKLGSPQGSPDIDIVVYQVFVDQEDFALSTELDSSSTSLLVPAGLLPPGAAKLEVLVREASHNQTATETFFVVK